MSSQFVHKLRVIWFDASTSVDISICEIKVRTAGYQWKTKKDEPLDFRHQWKTAWKILKTLLDRNLFCQRVADCCQDIYNNSFARSFVGMHYSSTIIKVDLFWNRYWISARQIQLNHPLILYFYDRKIETIFFIWPKSFDIFCVSSSKLQPCMHCISLTNKTSIPVQYFSY